MFQKVVKALENCRYRNCCYTYSRNKIFFAMTSNPGFQPLTKEDVAKILGISARCIENWVNNGTLIAPAKLGNRVYWHPDVFFKWLGDHLTQQHAVAAQVKGRPASADDPCQPSSSKLDGHERELKRLQNNTQLRLSKLMAS